MLILSLLIILILLPTFVFAFSKKFQNTFSKNNSKGIDIIFEFLVAIVYFLIIIFTFLLDTSNNLFYFSLGLFIYLFGLILTYIGYYDFAKNNGD